jgi:hypothetical protein
MAMGTLDIPLVKPETTIQDALDQMSLVDRCAVVVQRPGASELLYVRQVLEARDEGLAEVGQIQDGVPLLDANSAGVRAAALDLVEPRRTWQAYEDLFHSYTRQHFVREYFVASLRPRTAMVAAAHTAAGRSLGMLAGYIGPAGLDLPLMEPEIEIDDALIRMSSLQRSVVVVEAGNAGLLMPEPMLRQSRGLGVRLLGAASGGLPVPFLSYRETAASGLSLAGPRRLDSFFGSYPQHLVLAARVPRTVTLVTSRESLALTLSGSKYSCNGQTRPYGRPHYFPNPSVNDGDNCPKWPACNVDGTRTIISRII